jgi:hypothetical protein
MVEWLAKTLIHTAPVEGKGALAFAATSSDGENQSLRPPSNLMPKSFV